MCLYWLGLYLIRQWLSHQGHTFLDRLIFASVVRVQRAALTSLRVMPLCHKVIERAAVTSLEMSLMIQQFLQTTQDILQMALYTAHTVKTDLTAYHPRLITYISMLLVVSGMQLTIAPYVDIILHRERFWAKSAASRSVRWCCFRSCWTVLRNVMSSPVCRSGG